MTLTTEKNGTALTVRLSGELNTLTAPELTALLNKELGGVNALTLDFAENYAGVKKEKGVILISTYRPVR